MLDDDLVLSLSGRHVRDGGTAVLIVSAPYLRL